jgi:hypothetical protein
VLNLVSGEHYIKMVIIRLTFTSHALCMEEIKWSHAFIVVLSKFPHYWVFSPLNWCNCRNAEQRIGYERSTFISFKICLYNDGTYCWMLNQNSVSAAIYLEWGTTVNTIMSRMYDAFHFIYGSLMSFHEAQ